jgi:orotate phosphoribosyltransferase
MTNFEILKTLGEISALIKDSHIVYTSGRHGSSYVNKDAIYPHAHLTSKLCQEMARRFSGQNVDTVLAPAIGGVILSQWVAYHLTEMEGREIPGVYAEKEKSGTEDLFVIKRGYDRFVRGKRVLLLEDIITTGISIKRVVEAVRALGGEVVGIAALCNRGGISPAQLGDVPRLDALAELNLDSWDAKECPLCAKNIPVNTEVGKGREFLAARKN